MTRGTLWESERGVFKTPLREATKHPPNMHDGSIATLREVVEFYNGGGNPNPDMSWRLRTRGPLGLSADEVGAIVDFLRALEGESWHDTGPTQFPR